MSEHPVNRLQAIECPEAVRAEARQSPVTAQQRQADVEGLRPQQWRSGDVGVTTKLSDGRVLWIFGDTVRARGTKPLVAANSMLVSDGRCFSEVRTPSSGPVIPDRPGEKVCWPNSALTIPMAGRDIVVVGCSRVARARVVRDPKKESSESSAAAGLFDFTYRGMTLATFVVPHGGAPQPLTTRDVTPDSDDSRQINWGAAMVGDDGWIYVYGSQQPKGSAGKGAYVARSRVADLAVRGGWQYWDGKRFRDDAASARPFLLASEGVSQTFSVVAWHGGFVLVSKQGGEFGANVGVWRAPHPYGPWSGFRAVPQPYSVGDGIVAYQPLAHPELATPTGDLLVSLSRTRERFADLLGHPEQGRPMFLTVPAG